MNSHTHNHDKNLGFTIFLNVLISVAEGIGGLSSGSSALLADALHNLSDVISLFISWAALKLSQKEESGKFTFGFKKAEVLATFINSLTLIVIAIIIIYEAIKNLLNPVEIKADIVIGLALLSIILNALSVLLLHNGSKESMNIKSSYLHLLTDMLTSVAVLIGGLLMKFTGIKGVDSVISLLIAFYLIISIVNLLRKSVQILLDYNPKYLEVDKMVEDIKRVGNIKNVHHIHIWQLDEKNILIEAHILFEKDIFVSEFSEIRKKITNILKEKYGITHYNLQPEAENCSDGYSVSKTCK